jgi:CheY-like chemotaxis protein
MSHTAPELHDTALVVDDNPLDAHLASAMLTRALGLKTAVAANGQLALDWLKGHRPALVITDLQMPEMDGLELVGEMASRYPEVPVVLTTASGSEEVAFQALQAGASSYVPKQALAEQLAPTVQRVIALAQAGRRKQMFLAGINRVELSLALENDEALVPAFIQHVQDYMIRLGLCGANSRLRAAVALEEAMLNGIYHGNLEVSSKLKEEEGKDAFRELADRRKTEEPYRGRRLHVDIRMDRQQGTFVIRDEGPGFDVTKVPDPTDPENLLKPSGRGLLLIRMFMQEVAHNAGGNEITMVRRPAPSRH